VNGSAIRCCSVSSLLSAAAVLLDAGTCEIAGATYRYSLQGESDNLALRINDARFEYGPVDMFLSPTPPPRQVTGVSIYLKKGPWAFIFELSERENTWFGLGNELMPRQIGTGIEDEETAGWD
jgi:hypothetical protein